MELPELHRVVGAVQAWLQPQHWQLHSSTQFVPFHCPGDLKLVLAGKAALENLAFLPGKANSSGVVHSCLSQCGCALSSCAALAVAAAAGSSCSSDSLGMGTHFLYQQDNFQASLVPGVRGAALSSPQGHLADLTCLRTWQCR